MKFYFYSFIFCLLHASIFECQDCPLNCINGGICKTRDYNNNTVHYCSCKSGYHGELCDLKPKICKDIIKINCQNGATCVIDPSWG